MKEKNNNKQILTLVLCLLCLVAITVGVSYAFFQYVKNGTKENVITTGTLTFLYTEMGGTGAGINIENAVPIADNIGKNLIGDGQVFDFKITSNTTLDTSIPYEITVRKKSNSTLSENLVKIYLTELDGNVETEVSFSKYSDLKQTTTAVPNGVVEKTIYNGIVKSKSSVYDKTFRLRMWLDNDGNYSSDKDSGKSFTITVNVYANTKVISEKNVSLGDSVEIESIYMGDVRLFEVKNQDYDYDLVLSQGVTSASFTVNTVNPKATVIIERDDSLASGHFNNRKYMTRLSTIKDVTLNSGFNYFSMKIVSENGSKSVEKKIRVEVPISNITS